MYHLEHTDGYHYTTIIIAIPVMCIACMLGHTMQYDKQTHVILSGKRSDQIACTVKVRAV